MASETFRSLSKITGRKTTTYGRYGLVAFFLSLNVERYIAPPLGPLKTSAGNCSRFANGVADADRIAICEFADILHS